LNASEIHVLDGREGVRKRPEMYFGVGADDPALPLRVLLEAVDDAVWEVAVGPALDVRVVIESDRRFRIEDNGPGLPTKLTGPKWAGVPWVVRMLTSPAVGTCPPRGTNLAVPAALCSQVTAIVRSGGRGYRVDAGFRNAVHLTEMGPAEGHGTSVSFALDEAYLAEGAVLPLDPAPAIQAALAAPRWGGKTRVRGRVELLGEDHRTGSQARLTVLPNGDNRCAACHFDCEDPLAMTS
jgi:DNA gyrase/topoisomerase IV subunit B